MNLKCFKQRASHSGTPIKRSQNTIQLSQFFSRPSHQISNANYFNVEYLHKQNYPPNLEIYNRNKNTKQSPNQITPKRKVIHLKSVSRNSKSKKNQNSESMSKKYSVEQTFTEVTDFADNNVNNSKHGIIIEVDLKKHRRSIQDTLTSSVAQNQFLIRSQLPTCCQHIEKKATFLVKGKPYCDKCAAKFITKGFVAVKIDNERLNQPQQLQEQHQYQEDLNNKQKRNNQLHLFIQSLDKIDPILQSIGTKLQSYSYWLSEYYEYQMSNLENSWNKMLSFLENLKKQLDKNFKIQKEKADQMMQQTRIKVKEETENLNFMRNDIIRNIDKIIDENKIPNQKFVEVMNDFKAQLEDISQNTIKIQRNNLNLPKVEFDLLKLDQQIHKYINIKSVSQELFSNTSFDTPTERSYQQNFGEDPYRLSFGKQMQKIQSPTFKVL